MLTDLDENDKEDTIGMFLRERVMECDAACGGGFSEILTQAAEVVSS